MTKKHERKDGRALGTGASGSLDKPGVKNPNEGELQPAGDAGRTSTTTDSDVVAGEAGQGA